MNKKAAERGLVEFEAARVQIAQDFQQGTLTFEQASCRLWSHAKGLMQQANPIPAAQNAQALPTQAQSRGEPWLCLA